MTVSAWGVDHGDISKAMSGFVSGMGRRSKGLGMKGPGGKIAPANPFELNLGGVPDSIRSAAAQSAKAREAKAAAERAQNIANTHRSWGKGLKPRGFDERARSMPGTRSGSYASGGSTLYNSDLG